jgi:hypothetical protein
MKQLISIANKPDLEVNKYISQIGNKDQYGDEERSWK